MGEKKKLGTWGKSQWSQHRDVVHGRRVSWSQELTAVWLVADGRHSTTSVERNPAGTDKLSKCP